MNENKTNPFIENLVIDAGREVTDFYKYIKNKKKYDADGIIPTVHLERSDKIFIYTSPTIRSVLSSLSGSASKVFLWIQQMIRYGEDYIKFNSKNFMKETNMAPATLIKAKKELIDKQIIAEMEGENKYYWVNPAILFKGNRVRKYPDNLSIFKSSGDNVTSDSKIK